MEWPAEQWRVPEPEWESMEECNEGYRREELASSRCAEELVISPVPSVPGPCIRPEEPETVREAMEKLRESGERCFAGVFCSTFDLKSLSAVW